ncbi:conserved hypothetical protein [Ricinus communis]|uniref:Uncharacterized protein n=1 Tax=Ricinus communis TaxID=3988 RepID=B9SRP0_RICCO|nr:conserved hypothetical protein [Ricinus communis]
MVQGEICWDLQVVNGLSNERDKEQILRIPLSTRNTTDKWWWTKDIKGCYTIKSGTNGCITFNLATMIFKKILFGRLCGNSAFLQRIIKAATKLYHGLISPQLAEAMGIREAFRWLKLH